jgi:hypothetical protein
MLYFGNAEGGRSLFIGECGVNPRVGRVSQITMVHFLVSVYLLAISINAVWHN